MKGLNQLPILVGATERIESDSTRFAEKTRASGVNITLDTWEQISHEWQFVIGFFPEAHQAVQGIGKFINTHWSTD